MIPEGKHSREINTLVARRGDEYYFLQKLFQHDENFRGATGTTMVPVTIEEHEDAQNNAKESLKEVWQEAVRSGSTEDSLETWVAEAVAAGDAELFFDLSYYSLGEEAAERYNERTQAEGDDKAEFSNCVGCGRMFSKDWDWGTMDEIFAPELIPLIDEYEGKESRKVLN